jgi:hypothetical protein
VRVSEFHDFRVSEFSPVVMVELLNFIGYAPFFISAFGRGV